MKDKPTQKKKIELAIYVIEDFLKDFKPKS